MSVALEFVCPACDRRRPNPRAAQQPGVFAAVCIASEVRFCGSCKERCEGCRLEYDPLPDPSTGGKYHSLESGKRIACTGGRDQRTPVRMITTPPYEPHAFVKSMAGVRRWGAPMRNPPQPEDLTTSPWCAVCRRLANDPLHRIG